MYFTTPCGSTTTQRMAPQLDWFNLLKIKRKAFDTVHVKQDGSNKQKRLSYQDHDIGHDNNWAKKMVLGRRKINFYWLWGSDGLWWPSSITTCPYYMANTSILHRLMFGLNIPLTWKLLCHRKSKKTHMLCKQSILSKVLILWCWLVNHYSTKF